VQGPCCPLARLALWYGDATVGDLMALCEENFTLLSRLAPGLSEASGLSVSRIEGGVDLHLSVEEQSRYTTVLRLTHYFDEPARPGGRSPRRADPDALLRVYHDARQVEVLDLRQTVLPRHTEYRAPALAAKWRLNLFLFKWLSYCLQQGHRFAPGRTEVRLPQDGGLIDTCI
jgi:uncharacterized protein YqiB (DUF1249 family)